MFAQGQDIRYLKIPKENCQGFHSGDIFGWQGGLPNGGKGMHTALCWLVSDVLSTNPIVRLVFSRKHLFSSFSFSFLFLVLVGGGWSWEKCYQGWKQMESVHWDPSSPSSVDRVRRHLRCGIMFDDKITFTRWRYQLCAPLSTLNEKCWHNQLQKFTFPGIGPSFFQLTTMWFGEPDY